jgi:hypothetical protein
MMAPPPARASHGPFAAALLDPAIDPTPLLAPPMPHRPRHRSDRRRFDVHRNTVMSSLVRALAEGFPSVERLVGATFFAAMAAEFVRATPPSHPVLLAYGAGFDGFLARFEPVTHWPYLADVARLDSLRRRAWHAADVPALDAAALAAADPVNLAERRVALHPSVGVLGSPHPARTLWALQNGADDGAPKAIVWQPETALVRREGHAIRVEAIDAGLLALLDAARHAPTLGALLEADSETQAQARAAAFASALGKGLLVDIEARDRAMTNVPDAMLFDAFLPRFPAMSTNEVSP